MVERIKPNQRQRKRVASLKIDRTEIFERVKDFHDKDLISMSSDRARRLQLYAKFRGWVSGKDWPWANSSDIALTDMMEKSLRVQDTLHNAVMSQEPPVFSKANNPQNKDKQDTVDNLITYQFFQEQEGQKVVGDLADAFVNDGVFTAFIPWIKEMRETSDVRVFPTIPQDLLPVEYFEQLLVQNLPEFQPIPKKNGWDWNLIGDDENAEASFFTNDEGLVEMIIKREVEVYNGPKIIVKDYEDVLHPARVENLQIPGPSNTTGASHVILRDHPTIDEIRRLNKSKFYDLMTKEDMEALENYIKDDSQDDEKKQKDDLAGRSEDSESDKVKSHRPLTRLTCFDIFDIDGDGINEDVIWWVLLEPKIVVKAKILTEMFPSNPPRRPFAEAAFIPIRGRRGGISLLEMMEGIHDVMKIAYDQMVDAGTIANAPYFFYKASSTMKPEIIELAPGQGYPLADPSKDVKFNDMNNNAMAFGLNLIGILSQMEDKVTMIGDLQLGRVPAGKSSALRTVGGMALLAGQGEARPERMLRRFFMGFTEIYKQFHELNQVFLPKDKQFRISGFQRPDMDPYQTITDQDNIKGRFQFTFKANVLNTSKAALEQSLNDLAGLYINAFTIQLGIVDADKAYRLLRDIGKAKGQDPDNYLNPPTPQSQQQLLLAEEAISAIMNSEMPTGIPEETGGAMEHLQKLTAFMQSNEFSFLSTTQIGIFQVYLTQVQQLVQQQQQQQALLQAAQQFGGQGQGQANPTGRPAQQPPPDATSQTPVSGPGEILDESLPGAGGGTVQ